jgi:hypothetical protein
MPLHRIDSHEDEDDWAVLDKAVKQIEANGEEITQVFNYTGYPIGSYYIFTRKTGRRGPAAEHR